VPQRLGNLARRGPKLDPSTSCLTIDHKTQLHRKSEHSMPSEAKAALRSGWYPGAPRHADIILMRDVVTWAANFTAAVGPKNSAAPKTEKHCPRSLEVKQLAVHPIAHACDRAASNLYSVSRVTGPADAGSVCVSGAVSHPLSHLFLFLSGRSRRPRSPYFDLCQLSGVEAPRSGLMPKAC
jgi:hypothetical protein